MRRLTNPRVLMAGWMAALLAAAPAGAGAQTLADAMVSAYGNSPELAEARAELEAAAVRAV